jgi:hypothetical protein
VLSLHLWKYIFTMGLPILVKPAKAAESLVHFILDLTMGHVNQVGLQDLQMNAVCPSLDNQPGLFAQIVKTHLGQGLHPQ